MRSVRWRALAALASIFFLNHATHAADLPTAEPPPTAPPSPAACTSVQEFYASDCPLTWHGITLYGTYDLGVGWVSHGLPESPYNYEGESLVNRNGNHPQFLIAPNNLSQTGLGIKGKEEVLQGWSVVFNASTGINPQSGQLANLAATNTSNNGLPRSSYSFAGDGARARAKPSMMNSMAAYRPPLFGTLTFGRQTAHGTDAMLAYMIQPAAPIPFRSSATTA